MKSYFLSDAHLGSLAFPDRLDRERRLVVLGECYELCTYGVLDDNGFRLDSFAE